MNTINLNELNMENIGQWPYVVKLSMFFLIIIIVIGMGYWFFIGPNFKELTTLEAKELTLRKEFEDKQRKASTLSAYKQQLSEIRERFANVIKQLPPESEMPGLLEDISKTGISAGLNFELFAPQKAIKHDFYIELPIKIRVMGTYDQLAIFLSRVAELSRIVTLHDFVISSASTDSDKAAKTDNKLTMDITAEIYWYRAR